MSDDDENSNKIKAELKKLKYESDISESDHLNKVLSSPCSSSSSSSSSYSSDYDTDENETYKKLRKQRVKEFKAKRNNLIKSLRKANQNCDKSRSRSISE